MPNILQMLFNTFKEIEYQDTIITFSAGNDARSVYSNNWSQILQYVKYTKWKKNIAKGIANLCENIICL